MDAEKQKILVDPEFVKKILTLKTKDEVKEELIKNGIEFTEEEFNQYIEVMLDVLDKVRNNEEISDKALDEVVGGKGYKAVAAVGRVISFPFRAVAYGTGAILGGLPKGFVDGVYDAWTNWKDYDEEDSNKRRR